jgi:hypothetical protein
MKSEWITRKGVKRFHLHDGNFRDDFASLKSEADSVHGEVMKHPVDSVLKPVDVRSTAGSKEIVDLLRAAVSESKPFIRRVSAIGVTGVRNVIMSLTNLKKNY